jgi:hypothetical protein
MSLGVLPAVLGILTTTALAQPVPLANSDRERSEAAALYFTSTLMPAGATFCDERLPGFRSRFDAKYAEWRRANATALQAGESVTMEFLPGLGKTLEEHQHEALAALRRKAAADADAALRHCRALARTVGMSMP